MQKYAFYLAIVFCALTNVHAWNGHALLTTAALQNNKELNIKNLKPEPLEEFLQKEEKGIGLLLQENETWAIQNIKYYPSLPSNLVFSNNKTPIKTRFINALRVNPELQYPLYIEGSDLGQLLANKIEPRSKTMLSFLVNAPWIYIEGGTLKQISADDLVSPLTVIATASDEPDYGMDINLWEDNDTAYGRLYKWGMQPFGNNRVSFATQAPFHMGFYYESRIINLLTPNFQHSYLEYRAHTYLALARYAFKTHHDYWGYRFLGWSLHYVQDLGQPYHSTLAPNISTLKIFFAQGLDAIGFHNYKAHKIILVTNRHYAFEDYVYYYLRQLFDDKKFNDPILLSMANVAADANYPAYTNNYPRDVVAKESTNLANDLDTRVRNAFPPLYVDNPDYIFYMTDPYINLVKVIGEMHSEDLDKLHVMMQELLGHVAAHTRNLVKFARSK